MRCSKIISRFIVEHDQLHEEIDNFTQLNNNTHRSHTDYWSMFPKYGETNSPIYRNKKGCVVVEI